MSGMSTRAGHARASSISLLWWLCAVGCACAGQPFAADPAAEVYARATNQFAAAILFKPSQATNADLACQLAPLIIQEVSQGGSTEHPPGDHLGTLALSNGVPALDPSRPAVYWTADAVQLNGKSHARISYEWWCSAPQPSGRPTALHRQGVRITLDTRGHPATWEILADTSGLRLIFISRGLEKAAAAAFDKPSPGRRYSIERDLAQTPNVIVPRVIDDSSVTMGPIVYLSLDTHNVTTLICRCMPAQVKQITATRPFDLTPLDAADSRAFPAVPGTTVPTSPVSWPGDERVENRLDKCLRLPEAF